MKTILVLVGFAASIAIVMLLNRGAERFGWSALTAAGNGTYGFSSSSVLLLPERTPVKKADSSSFQVWNDLTQANGFARDKMRVFYFGNELKGADPSTFQPLYATNGEFSGYMRDKINVFFANYIDGAAILADADVVTFRLLGTTGFYAQDNQNVFANGGILVGADAATFEVLSDTQRPSARDRTHLFEGTEAKPYPGM